MVTSITVSSHGNSPQIKMIGGMMVDVQKDFVGMTHKPVEASTDSEKSRKLSINPNAKLTLNERYRRLIPYMTFYYANDISSTTEPYTSKDVEVEKAEIVEARTLDQRQPKKLIYSSHRNIPRYQGNRLTHFNLASANPVKIYYKDVPLYHNSIKVTPNLNPLIQGYVPIRNQDYERDRYIPRPVVKPPSIPFVPITTRKPFLKGHSVSDPVQFYVSEKQAPKFKLVPYEQTAPLNPATPQTENVYESQKSIPVPVLIPKDQVYIKPRPLRPQYDYDNVNIQQLNIKKLPSVVSESYYEKQHLSPQSSTQTPSPRPGIRPEGGFRPIAHPVTSTEAPIYTTASPPTQIPEFDNIRTPVEATQAPEFEDNRPNYYQYVVEQPIYKPEEYIPTKSVTLSDLLNSLQLNKSIPKPITKENVGASIRTLLQVLNALKAMSQTEETHLFSTPTPFVPSVPEAGVEVTPKPIEASSAAPIDDVELQEPYLAPVNPPSQYLDDLPPNHGGSRTQFPPPVHSDEEGGTPGSPGVDYPILTSIPSTAFDCKTQRYKGFFADPETRCQVWHYCDLNGGQASFLCPNGTIFSQAALTCDWWFNVRCASTTQLYVLNESLYKYILPHSPKFPEDYSGPLVDKYLTLKFKEMEEQFKKNKNKQASEKVDGDETGSSNDDPAEQDRDSASESEDSDKSEGSSVSEASVLVQSPGTSGNVERLQDP